VEWCLPLEQKILRSQGRYVSLHNLRTRISFFSSRRFRLAGSANWSGGMGTAGINDASARAHRAFCIFSGWSAITIDFHGHPHVPVSVDGRATHDKTGHISTVQCVKDCFPSGYLHRWSFSLIVSGTFVSPPLQCGPLVAHGATVAHCSPFLKQSRDLRKTTVRTLIAHCCS
jgi:hypothetical protein